MSGVGLSFSACGFLGLYHLGAASALCSHGTRVLRDATGFAGASAGALVAAVLLTAPHRLEDCVRFTHVLADDVRSHVLGPGTPGFDFLGRLRAGLDWILPCDAHALACGHLHVSVTNTRSHENHRVSHFATRDELIQVLLASCFIPVYMGRKPVSFAGQTWADGGFSDSLPVFPAGRTVTVSPFHARADVSPPHMGRPGVFLRVARQDVALSVPNLVRLHHALFPPSRVTRDTLFHDGFRDAVRFLRREGWYC